MQRHSNVKMPAFSYYMCQNSRDRQLTQIQVDCRLRPLLQLSLYTHWSEDDRSCPKQQVSARSFDQFHNQVLML